MVQRNPLLLGLALSSAITLLFGFLIPSSETMAIWFREGG